MQMQFVRRVHSLLGWFHYSDSDGFESTIVSEDEFFRLLNADELLRSRGVDLYDLMLYCHAMGMFEMVRDDGRRSLEIDTKSLVDFDEMIREYDLCSEVPEGAAQELGNGSVSTLDDSALKSVAELAEFYHVPKQSLDARLRRWRKNNAATDGYLEVHNTNPRAPQFLYRVGAIRSVCEDLKSKTEKLKP